MPGKLSEEDAPFEVSEAERGQDRGEEKRRPKHHSEDASRLLFLSLWGLCYVSCVRELAGGCLGQSWGPEYDL